MTRPPGSFRRAGRLLCLGVLGSLVLTGTGHAGPDTTATRKFLPFEGDWRLEGAVAGSDLTLEFYRDADGLTILRALRGVWYLRVLRVEGEERFLTGTAGLTAARRALTLTKGRLELESAVGPVFDPVPNPLFDLLGRAGTIEGGFAPGAGFEAFDGAFVGESGQRVPFRAVRVSRIPRSLTKPEEANTAKIVNRLRRVVLRNGRFRRRRAGSVRQGEPVLAELLTVSRGPAVTPPRAVVMTVLAPPAVTDLRVVGMHNMEFCTPQDGNLVVCRAKALGPPGAFTNAAVQVAMTAVATGRLEVLGMSAIDPENAVSPIAAAGGRDRRLRIKVRGPKEQGACRGKRQQNPPPFEGGLRPTCDVNAFGVLSGCFDPVDPVFALVFGGDRLGKREFLIVCGDGLQQACMQFERDYVVLGTNADVCAALQTHCTNAAELPSCAPS